MAITADEVEVRLEASVVQYVADLGLADKAFQKMSANARKYAVDTGAAFTDLNKVSGQSLDRIAPAANKATAAIKGTGFQTANLAAQLNDIGVTLASGQNPFLIALQQGTQINQVIGHAGAAGAVSALGDAFVSLINPVSIATIAVIALGGAAIQYLTKSSDGADVVNAKLKQQKEFIDNIPAAYARAKSAAEAYQVAAAPPKAEFIGNTEDQRAKALKDEAEQLKRLVTLSKSVDFAPAQEVGGIFAITQAEREANAELEKNAALLVSIGQAAAQANPDLNSVVLQLQDFIRNNPTGTLHDVANAMLQSAINARDFAHAAGEAKAVIDSFPENVDVNIRLSLQQDAFSDAFKKLSDLKMDPVGDNQFDEARKAAQAAADDASKQAVSYGAAAASGQRLKEVIDSIDAAEKASNANKARSSGASAAKSAAEDLKRQRDAVVDLIASLQFEGSLIGKSKEDQAVMTALRKAGAIATDDQRTAIEELVRANYENAEAQAKMTEDLQNFLDIGKSGLETFINDILDGKDAVESLGDALKNIGSQLISSGLSSLFGSGGPIASLFTGGGGINLGSGIAGGAISGHKALGGPVNAGHSYIVGDGGVPEVFTPASAGSVTPMSSGGNQQIVFAPQIDATGADTAAVARLEVVLQRMQSEFTTRVRKEISGQGRTWQ